jgi:hypothetical protein
MKLFCQTIIFLILFTIVEARSSHENSFVAFRAQITDSWKSLDRYMQTCLEDSRHCGLNPEEVSILRKIVNIFPEEVKKTKLISDSGKANPRRFNMGGAPRIAVTDSKPFSPIYFNIDLCIDETTGTIIPRETGISFLVHELGHHLGIGDTEERVLDKIGEAVATKVKSLALQIDLVAEDEQQLGAFVFNQSNFDDLKKKRSRKYRLPHISIHTGLGVENLNDVIIKKLSETYPDICPDEPSVQLIHLNNLRWFKTPGRQSGSDLSMLMNLQALCGRDTKSSTLLKAFFIYYSPLTKKNGQLIMDSRKGGGKVVHTVYEDEGVAEIKSFNTNTSRISPAGTWRGSALIEYRGEKEFAGCQVFFKGTHFFQNQSGLTFPVATQECHLRKTNSSRFEVNFLEFFSEMTSSGVYAIDSIALIPKYNVLAPIYIQPPRRITVSLSNNSTPPEIVKFKIYDRNMRELNDTGVRDIPQGFQFQFAVWLLGRTEELLNFEIRFSGIDQRGRLINDHLAIRNWDDKPWQPNMRYEGATCFLIVWEVPYLGLKDIRFKTIELIDSDLHANSIPFPKTFGGKGTEE